ncbi:hypothetical protein VaNZ11_002060 [Volvox africanus]|uniref:Uncharacterized protein n=1 Tax=Volvox africanus TaxID=51714 RepID=A0ABQ5RR08_9CHLO|nr:hypothetical protein VaNZ11_002060 [Volvox africanus]
MGTDDGSCFGCLPWRRRQVSSTRTTNTSVTKPLRPTTANNGKIQGILKTAPEPSPAKWRSQLGASESSSTASVNGVASESGPLATHNISATALGPADEVLTVAASPQARTRSALGPTQIRFASQLQIHPAPVGSPTASNSSLTATSCQTRTGVTSKTPPPGEEAAFGDPDGPIGNGASVASAPPLPQPPAATTAGGGWSSADAASRLQDLQERFRQRASSTAPRNGDVTAAVAPRPPGIMDHLGSSDQMQCDSFTYCTSVYGRRSSNGGRLGTLPPLSPSPARTGKKNVPMGQAHSRSHGGGGGGGGYTTGRQAQKRDQVLQDDRQNAAQTIYAPELSRGSMTAHIPGSLPSMTQPQASPAATRIYPQPSATAATSAVAVTTRDIAPPMAPEALPLPITPQPPRVSWSEMSVAPVAVAATAAAAAAAQQQQLAVPTGNNPVVRSGKSLGLQDDVDQCLAVTGGSADEDERGNESDVEGPDPSSCDVQGFSFSSHWSRTPSRFAGGAGGGDSVSVSSNGAPLYRAPHGSAGFSAANATTTAAAAAAAGAGATSGFSAPERQVAAKLPADHGTAAGAISLPLPLPLPILVSADFDNDPHHPPGDPRQTTSRRLLQERNDGGGGGGGGATSLQMFDSFTPGGVPARPPSFLPQALELRTAPGCMTSSSAPPLPPKLGEAAAAATAIATATATAGGGGRMRVTDSDLLSSPSPSLSPSSPSLPQHRFSLRLLPEQVQPPQGSREGPQQTEIGIKKMAFGDALQGAPSKRSLQLVQQYGDEAIGAVGTTTLGADIEAPGKETRPGLRAAQQRMQAARANEEMLQALLGSSKRALPIASPRTADIREGGAAAELERFDRVQDAMSRLDGILAASPPPAPAAPAAAAASARSLNARVGASRAEDAASDFPGATPATSNPDYGVKVW